MLLVCNELMAGEMVADLSRELMATEQVELSAAAGRRGSGVFAEEDADKVLVLLTAGVMTEHETLSALERVLAADAATGADRVVLVFHEAAGWKFGCAEQIGAPLVVRRCLEEHEAIAYRPRDEGGSRRHEFPAMVRQLMKKLILT